MLKSTKWALLAGTLLASLILSACQGQTIEVPVTVVVRQTQEVQVIQTQEVEVTIAVGHCVFDNRTTLN